MKLNIEKQKMKTPNFDSAERFLEWYNRRFIKELMGNSNNPNRSYGEFEKRRESIRNIYKFFEEYKDMAKNYISTVLTEKEREYVCWRANYEGFDYAFTLYSDFSEIENETFHELRLTYKSASETLQKYINQNKLNIIVEQLDEDSFFDNLNDATLNNLIIKFKEAAKELKEYLQYDTFDFEEYIKEEES